MKARKLPSGNYIATAFLGLDDAGKQIRKSFTAKTSRDAVAMAMEYERRHKIVVVRGSFRDAMQRFLRDRAPVLSPSTLAEYSSRSRCLLRSHISFCARNVNSIDQKALALLVADMSASGLSPKSIKNYIMFVSAVLKYDGVDMPRVELPKKTMPDIYVPTDAEVRILIDFVRGTEMYVPVLLAAFAPLRRGEICALTYPRDFDGDIIHVREAIAEGEGKKLHRKAPKTPYSDRFLRLPSFVLDAIIEQGYVTKLKPDDITHRFWHAVKNAGLPHFRFHDLRHYCVSTLHAQGVPDAYIMQRGGWSTDSVLKRVYRHTLSDQVKANEEKALAHFGKIFFD